MTEWIILTIPFAGTALGAAMVFLLKNGLGSRVKKLLLGFASGVMIAASVWSLLIPSIEMAEAQGKPAWLPALIGFMLGIGFLLVLDTVIPHLHLDGDKPEGVPAAWKKTTMMVFAVTLHNIPEGMVSQITVNNYEGTRIATRYLISLGHRELVFLGGRDSSVTHRFQPSCLCLFAEKG